MTTETHNTDQPHHDQPDGDETHVRGAGGPGVHGRRPPGRVDLGKHHGPTQDGVFVGAGGVVEGQVLDDEHIENETARAATATPPPAGKSVGGSGAELVRMPRPVSRTDRGPAGGLVRHAGGVAKRQTVQVLHAVRVVATHDRTKAVARGSARHVWFPIAGAAVVSKRWRDTHGANRYERMMRAAETAGDRDALLEWEARDVAEKTARHSRVMDWVRSPLDLIRAVALGAAGVVGLLLALGVILAIAHHDLNQVIGPISAVTSAIAWLVWLFTIYGTLLITLGTVGGLAYLWQIGRTHTEPPTWAAPPTDAAEGRDVVPDEGAILNALKNLNLPALNRKVREGWTPRWVAPTVRDGKGWRTQLLLPEGVTVLMIHDRKDVLAHNLLRVPVEVWPTEPKTSPGVLDLWVADQGSLTKPVEAWPLLTDGTVDIFRGVPVGIDPRGKTVMGRFIGCNWGVAGMMGSGKSTLIITALLGAMLDPIVEIDVYCMAINADYDPLHPRLRTLFTSDDPDEIPQVLDALRTLMGELSERGRILSANGEPKLTRALAETDPRMRPRIVVIDECQELFVSDIGEEAAELVEKIVAKARKYGVTMLFATPVPAADSLPRKVAKVLSNKACFAIGDHQGNDAILGTGKHKAGISATTLRPMTEDADGNIDLGDIGTAMTVGFTPTDGLMRCYYPRRGSGIDEVTPIVHRAMTLRNEAGITPVPVDEPPTRPDLLADIAAVLVGHKRMRTQEVLALLAGRNRPVYSGWTFTDLAANLPDAAKPYKSGGVMVIGTDRVTEAIADRTADNDDTESATDSDERAD